MEQEITPADAGGPGGAAAPATEEVAEVEVEAAKPEPRRWPTAVLIAVGVGALLLGLVGGTLIKGGSSSEQTATTGTASVSSTSTTTSSSTTTTVQRTTTTTAAPTTTSPPTPEEVKAAFPGVFDSHRKALLDALGNDENIQSVDRFEYDEKTGAVVLAVTSRWASPDNQDQGAWEITRSAASLWEPGKGVWYSAVWAPSFQLVNSGRYRNCSGEFMVKLADARASQGDWTKSC